MTTTQTTSFPLCAPGHDPAEHWCTAKACKAPPRPLHVIAREIRSDWTKVWFGAVPYLDAMSQLDSINDNYGCDPGKQIVAYFLGNATTWKGEVARRVKAELKAMLKR